MSHDLLGSEREKATKVRERIRNSQIIQRLIAHVQNDPDEPVLSKTQIDAANILLKKAYPDLKSVELTGHGSGPIEAVIRIVPHIETPQDDEASG